MANPNTPAIMTQEEKDKKMRELGFLPSSMGGNEINRVSVKGNNLVFNKEVIASYNMKSKEPALIVQLTDMPEEYQSMWFTPELAEAVGRPEVAGRFCKSHFDDPNEAREFSEAYEGKRQNCRECPVNPWKYPSDLPDAAKKQEGASKCAWKGDIEFRILEKQADGTYASEDDTIYTMTLPTTGIIEFKGSSSKKAVPTAGSVSQYHFMYQLAMMGMEKWGDEGLKKAQHAMRNGGVIAELHVPMTTNQDQSRSYNVVSFKPLDILEMEEQAQLPEAADEPAAKAEAKAEPKAQGTAEDESDLPF